MAHETHAKTLPADFGAPAFVDGWRTRALIVGAVFSVIAAGLALADGSIDHVLRAWLLGMMLTFGFSVGGLALLMVQYCSGGKWGLLLRRPLEAMSRTLPLVFVYWVVVALSHEEALPVGAVQRSADDAALQSGWIITRSRRTAIEFKRPMLNPSAFVWVSLVCFAIWGFYTWRLNSLGLERDAASPATTPEWIKRVGKHQRPGHRGLCHYHDRCGHLLGHVAGSHLVLVGLRAAVSGWAGIHGAGACNHRRDFAFEGRALQTILRQTEQHDLGKFTFAFVMLNIYLAFGQFLIIWSGNLPEEIPLVPGPHSRHWGVIITLDFIFHWLIPFTLLLSRDLKRNKKRLVRVCQWMVFARAFDLFWLIEPNFKDAARNLHFSWGILEYVAVPVAMVAFWVAYLLHALKTRPLVQTNDPHLAEILEPEHANA